tara:strand:+ start:553 stop:1428 length:876 start_codon:yes stop_codon:yes gene_type:complete
MKQLAPRRRFGQHFLINDHAARRIVSLVQPCPDDLVLEVGPGRGALTSLLLEKFDRIVAVEIDRDLAALLGPLTEAGLVVIVGDILKLDFGNILQNENRRKLCIVGNLPYNISGPFLFKLRSQAKLLSTATITLQREVALRIAAAPGSKAYGAITVMLYVWCRSQSIFQLPEDAFRPRPKVQSEVIQLEFSDSPRLKLSNEAMFEGLVRAAFGQRRKMLRNALHSWWTSLPAGSIVPLEDVATEVGIDLTQRAEVLSPGQYAEFSNALSETVKVLPKAADHKAENDSNIES